MKHTAYQLKDMNTYTDCMEAIKAIEMTADNYTAATRSEFYVGGHCELLKGAQAKIDAIEAKADKLADALDDELDNPCGNDGLAEEAEPEVQQKSGKQVGYIRVSTVSQKTDRQLADVQLDKVFEEKCSAKTVERPQLLACLDYLREGDTLHIHSLDRVCRSGSGDAVKLVEDMTSKGVGVKFHKEGMEFYGEMTAAQRGVLGILASVAQMERELINERSREGQQAAKAAGKHIGRPKQDNLSKENVTKVYEELEGNKSQIAKRLGVARMTIIRKCKEYGLEG
ncbi:recombinase family protein [Vibrio europaeus]|uniref:recombinase family protein n=1 Tax=Vibrio europaeus TaxID=300876 RepID=UPI00233E9393|nr:recombinase family protein [Vibrio europaeus]MDC5853477.1 recombinase family protein [Vibrio europaeus]